MIYQRQLYSNSCGHTVVAMVVGVPATEIIASIGLKLTSPRTLRNILARYHYAFELTSVRLPDKPQTPAALFCSVIRNHHWYNHWSLWTGEEFFDPSDPTRKEYGPEWYGRFYAIRPTL